MRTYNRNRTQEIRDESFAKGLLVGGIVAGFVGIFLGFYLAMLPVL